MTSPVTLTENDKAYMLGAYPTTPMRVLGERYGVTGACVRLWLRRWGVGPKPMGRELTADDKTYLRANHTAMSADAMGARWDVTGACVRIWLRRLGVHKRRPVHQVAPWERFFDDIDTEQKAYVLGFLYADGSVGHRPPRQSMVRAFQDDIDHMERIRETVGGGSVTKYKPNLWAWRAGSTYMADRLVAIGCVPRKSWKELPFPDAVPAHLVRHFVRGHFDGDGCAWIASRDGRPRLSFCGNLTFLAGIRGKIVEATGIYGRLYESCKKGRVVSTPHGPSKATQPCWQLAYEAKAGVAAVTRYLQEDATIFLPRKRAVLAA